MPSLALFQPDIALNVGSLARVATCWQVPLHIIHPCGFVWDTGKLKRSGMDYLAQAPLQHHDDWQAFRGTTKQQRLLALTTKTTQSYTAFSFNPDDILLLGQESAGLPQEVHAACDERLRIPMHGHARSLNVAIAGAVVLAEGLRQAGRL